MNQLEDAEMNFVTAVVPEAILCTKENGERPRQAAYSLLVEMANAVIRWSGEAEQGVEMSLPFKSDLLSGKLTIDSVDHALQCSR